MCMRAMLVALMLLMSFGLAACGYDSDDDNTGGIFDKDSDIDDKDDDDYKDDND